MWQHYYQPTGLAEVISLMQANPDARLLAGGTDVMVELDHGVRPTATVIDLSRVAGLRYVREEAERICLGALATHNDVIASPACVARTLPLAQACLEVGAPQIRTRGTVAGNLVTASPANDTITALVALGAEVGLVGPNGERRLPLADFYQGVRRTALAPAELLCEIRVPALAPDQRGIFLKLGLRRAQAIAVVNVAVVLTWQANAVSSARIALGCVAPTIIRATAAEAALSGQALSPTTIATAAAEAAAAARPIDDLRGSAAYRREAVAALVTRALERLAAGDEALGWPAQPVLLETRASPVSEQSRLAAPPATALSSVIASVNGRPTSLSAHKTLLDALREDAGLTGTKEGCAEGECGACTVWLDGQAVMSCLVPAAQAHGCEVTTIEGLAATVPGAGPTTLHPLQASFIAQGAVQCGYCIPGMLMAGARLLAEHPQPDQHQIQAALAGNLCRCTGYRKIITAVHAACGAVELPE